VSVTAILISDVCDKWDATINSHSPQGPAARSAASGLNTCKTFETIFTHAGSGVRRSASSGRSGNPHGSHRTKCAMRVGYLAEIAIINYW